jgi:N-acetylglucosaminyldiphosphoundecaprenol N-acetyl-beta-D-mannosaminyltransferase
MSGYDTCFWNFRQMIFAVQYPSVTEAESKFPSVNILGVPVAAITLQQTLEWIDRLVQSRKHAIIAHVNIRGLNIAYEQAWYSQFLNAAEFVYCDGTGVLLGAWMLGAALPERFTLADWMWQYAQFAEARRHRLFFLGNPPGTAAKAASNLQEHFPALQFAGTQHGYFNQTPGHPENEAVIAAINAARPDVLFVGFGMPTQERWLMHNWERLDAAVGISCGAIFEYVAGELKRGPHWMTENYMEWLARVFISPGRYWKRYARDIPLFTYRVLKQRFWGILPGG